MIRNYESNRKKKNPIYKLKKADRGRLWSALKSQNASRINILLNIIPAW